MINLFLLSQIIEVNPGGSLLDCTQKLNLMPGFNLEGFPNRDSTLYTTEYGIESAKTCIRGTLRYKVRAGQMYCLRFYGPFNSIPVISGCFAQRKYESRKLSRD